jgi:hypothetical protein
MCVNVLSSQEEIFNNEIINKYNSEYQKKRIELSITEIMELLDTVFKF